MTESESAGGEGNNYRNREVIPHLDDRPLLDQAKDLSRWYGNHSSGSGIEEFRNIFSSAARGTGLIVQKIEEKGEEIKLGSAPNELIIGIMIVSYNAIKKKFPNQTTDFLEDELAKVVGHFLSNKILVTNKDTSAMQAYMNAVEHYLTDINLEDKGRPVFPSSSELDSLKEQNPELYVEKVEYYTTLLSALEDKNLEKNRRELNKKALRFIIMAKHNLFELCEHLPIINRWMDESHDKVESYLTEVLDLSDPSPMNIAKHTPTESGEPLTPQGLYKKLEQAYSILRSGR